jgi:FHA domain
MHTWDAVVDVSNVCWSPQLPPVGCRKPLWRRLELVLAAWHELHGSYTRFVLVADDSLVRALDDVSEYRALRKKGELATRPVADSLILELARDRGLHVITRDHYVDHRVQHPWIENSPERFHCWSTVGGRVRIEPLDIMPSSAQTVSEAIEGKDLKRMRLDSRKPQHRRILGTRWKCDNTLCVQAAQWQDQLLVWPLVTSGGMALCPSCHFPLVELGRRDPLYEVVVESRSSHEEIMRFPVEVNSPMIIGRGTAVKGVNLAMHHGSFHSDLSRVSRQHLLMRIEEVSGGNRRIAVIDLDSSNGTEVERWTGTAFQRPKPLSPGREAILGYKDRLILGSRVSLRLSGKRYITPADWSGPSAPPVPPWPDPEGSTTALR